MKKGLNEKDDKSRLGPVIVATFSSSKIYNPLLSHPLAYGLS